MKNLLEIAINAALLGGKEILEVYNGDDFKTEIKQDNSPLTIADKRAHKAISEKLESTGFPVLSEEGRDIPFSERKNWEYFWMVDPLDGTKEFINRNGDFTVNIALIHNNKPVLGVVFVPVNGNMYFASQSNGSFRYDNCRNAEITDIINLSEQLPIKKDRRVYTVVASKSHMNEETKEFIRKLNINKGEIELMSRGSALKICMVAEGTADIYPRFGPTMEWDTAAGHAVAIESGCSFLQGDRQTEFVYNKENLLNPYFIVERTV